MATSNNIGFSVSRDDIIIEALEQLGVLGEAETPTEDQVQTCSRTLNMMVKNWSARGLNLFAVQKTFLFPEKDKRDYTLNITSPSRYVTGFTSSNTTAAASSGTDLITLTSAVDFAVGDTVLIPRSNNYVQETTVLSKPTSSQIQLTDVLEDNLDNDVTVIAYSQAQKANRPMDILEAYTVSGPNIDIPVERVSRREYNTLSNKQSKGIINQIYYDPQIDSSVVSVWPTTDNETNYIRLLVQRTLSDFSEGQDTPDFPQEWYLPISLNLAVLCGPKYGVPINRLAQIKAMADEAYEAASEFDTELQTSVFFQPSDR